MTGIYGGIGYKRILSTGSIPVFQGHGEDLQNVQGGFVLDLTGLAAGQFLPQGTPVIYDETTRLCKALPVAKAYANAAATDVVYQVPKGIFQVGQNFAAKIGNKAYPITAIDTTNPLYDSVTVSTTIGAVTAGDFLFASSTTGETTSSFGGVNGLLWADRYAEPNTPVSVLMRGTVYARRIAFSTDLAAALPSFFFSQSF